MEKTCKLTYNESKLYKEDGANCRIDAIVSLSDNCLNGICDWSVTGTTYRLFGNGRKREMSAGCIHREIREHFPHLEQFIKLHLSNRLGEPLYPVLNGMYHMKLDTKEGAAYLRISEEECTNLKRAADLDDQDYFKYLLFHQGITDRWKKESDEAIKELQKMTRKIWENPYKENEECSQLELSKEEIKKMESWIASGYFDPDQIEERRKRKEETAKKKAIKEIKEKYKKDLQMLRKKKDIDILLVKHGFKSMDAIYYNHNDTLVFNWIHGNVTREQYDSFVENAKEELKRLKITTGYKD